MSPSHSKENKFTETNDARNCKKKVSAHVMAIWVKIELTGDATGEARETVKSGVINCQSGEPYPKPEGNQLTDNCNNTSSLRSLCVCEC